MKPILVVLAAGMGSRYGGVKQIEGVGSDDEALLDYSVYDAMQSGFDRVVFIIRREIEEAFRSRIFDRISANFSASYVFQSLDQLLTPEQQTLAVKRKKPWGTVHALLCAKSHLHQNFCVINADDYYGRTAFTLMANHLSNRDVTSQEHAMVGYRLRQTTSPNGSVARAICQVEADYLVSMQENPKIFEAENRYYSEYEGIKRELSGNEWVSMNFFGFTPAAVTSFEHFFDSFLEQHVTSETRECYLPEAASQLVESQKGKIRVYTSDEKWFGMTYVEDRATVKAEIQAKIASGYYPKKLWR